MAMRQHPQEVQRCSEAAGFALKVKGDEHVTQGVPLRKGNLDKIQGWGWESFRNWEVILCAMLGRPLTSRVCYMYIRTVDNESSVDKDPAEPLLKRDQ